MKERHISEFEAITPYMGFTEMLLQEQYKKNVDGNYSELVYVADQSQYYVFGELTFEKVEVRGVSFDD